MRDARRGCSRLQQRPAPSDRSSGDPAGQARRATREPVSRSSVRLTWRPIDQHAELTWVALGGTFAALALAIWGLPPVDLHGPLHRLGIMDPLCGGTRAALFTVTAQWSLAWYYNPLGPLAIVAAGVMMLRAAVGVLTRRWLTLQVTLTRRPARAAFVALSLAALALSVRQQLMVDVLR